MSLGDVASPLTAVTSQWTMLTATFWKRRPSEQHFKLKLICKFLEMSFYCLPIKKSDTTVCIISVTFYVEVCVLFFLALFYYYPIIWLHATAVNAVFELKVLKLLAISNRTVLSLLRPSMMSFNSVITESWSNANRETESVWRGKGERYVGTAGVDFDLRSIMRRDGRQRPKE